MVILTFSTTIKTHAGFTYIVYIIHDTNVFIAYLYINNKHIFILGF